MKRFLPNLNKVTVLAGLAVGSLIMSMFAPVVSTIATQNSQLRLDTTAKNVSTGTAYGDSTNADIGQTIRVQLNLENLTSADLNNITVKAQLPSTASGSINVVGTAQSSAVGFLSDPTTVNLNSGTGYLNYVPNSTKIETIGGPVTSQPDANGTGPLFTYQGLSLSVNPGSSAQVFVYFDATVSSTSPTAPANHIDFTKLVRNVTRGGSFSSSVAANVGDVLQYSIYVHNGCTDGTCSDYPVTGVVITDALSQSGNTETNQATFSSNQAGPFAATATVTLPNGAGVAYVPGSTQVINPNDNSTTAIADVNGTSPLLTSAGWTFDEGQGSGILPFCNQYARNVVFEVKATGTVTPVVSQTVSKPPQLPKTGPEDEVVLLLLSMIPTGVLLRRFRV